MIACQLDLEANKVISDPRPYPVMKDSGLPWAGDVLKHWKLQRLKTLCSMRSGEAMFSPVQI
jgi:hypothetical protein